MRQIIVALLVGIVGVGTGMWGTQAAEEAAPAGTTPTTPAPAASAGGEAAPAGGGAAAGGACCKAGDTTPPLDLIKAPSKPACTILIAAGSTPLPRRGIRNTCPSAAMAAMAAAAVAACARR